MAKKCQITPQSKEGIAIKDAYLELQAISRSLRGISETLADPFKASQHIIEAQASLRNAENNLIATKVIDYKQLALGGANAR